MIQHKYGKIVSYTLMMALLITSILFLGACRKNKAARVSEGHEDNVKAFLLIFDTRSAQQQLVRDMEEGKIPVRLVCEPIEMTWVKKKNASADKKKKEETNTGQEDSDSEDGVVDREMVMVEKVIKDRVYVTEEEQKIRDIYTAMTDMIVVGQTQEQNNEKKCRVTYYLQDGTESSFEFDSVGLIKIGGQEYVLESDGSFWKLMPDMF